MSITSFVKRIQDITRNDAGVNGDAQRIEQMSWLLFLKIYDSRELVWELEEDDYESIIPEDLKWRNWAHAEKGEQVLTGDDLLDFVNNRLFKELKELEITPNMPIRKSIVKSAFEDANNYMKNGVLLRQVINVIDEVDFNSPEDRHSFNDIYEKILKDIQSAGNSGEFYTPRAATDFIAEMLDPKLGETMADLACGTGGFLTSTLNHLSKQRKTSEDIQKYNQAVFGIEKKAFPHLLAVTNLFLHEIDDPKIIHGNTLEKNVREYTDDEKFDLIMMNPPFGGSELDTIKNNFPAELRSSETADLFMAVIMYRLKENGRVGVILPDGFLFGEGVKTRLKEKLVEEFNLHTIIRLPHSVFAPYTGIHTNILFFDKTNKTEQTWFYRLDMPEGYKNFSKTKPMKSEHFNPVREWWTSREEILEGNFYKAKSFTPSELADLNYNFDQCGFPKEEEEILEPLELIQNYQQERAALNQKIDAVLADILELLEEN
ncbi:class I SAM-dependent DNA methyltransferase [Streptococcus agalactiae]|uniref:site-specific DNA-methyltransferase (adenine-specific) n=1 Tax=Streptococcus agalactiae MRI Z1-216 TaxID=1154879 RepID=A0AAD2WWP6_STRAG|nr:class I SAM-dependent DNA methyltransferase [Streptococcus agalactiae]EPU35499.1 type I restriction endonuclease subunit M [Streptococcus agalactiae MRI Z1-214]EPU37515.1 type I restriction endonuclease subunit M [Streptococcus agalactiae MRI Z1-213]EPU39314.1 type I restriction endonuclease subunit M [Streptococcus agalactiae MRI Z1-216]EPX06310.1 type I restriction endonuclease subunit M [Streptococcus agalactiae MRI Z1-217]KLL26379.1 restriction endonuclease subunit M [Streptococcus agal